MAFDFGGDRHESGVTETDLTTGDYVHAHSCDSCGIDLCGCGLLCPETAIEATPKTYPGWVAMPFLHVCVECAPEWADEQKGVR